MWVMADMQTVKYFNLIDGEEDIRRLAVSKNKHNSQTNTTTPLQKVSPPLLLVTCVALFYQTDIGELYGARACSRALTTTHYSYAYLMY